MDTRVLRFQGDGPLQVRDGIREIPEAPVGQAHLVDRRKMNSTIMYNQYFLHRSYYEDLYAKENPNPNPLFEMDKPKARKLLEEAGWKANPKTGILEKNGIPFDPSLVMERVPTLFDGKEAMGALLSLPEPPTAVFAAS